VDLSTSPPSPVRNRHGNLVGGIRLPHLEAPTGRHLGEGTPRDNRVCSFTGGYAPFDAATLASLYPTHAAYVSSVKAAAQRAVRAGHLLEADATSIGEEAEHNRLHGAASGRR
jgi:hypothetical protein